MASRSSTARRHWHCSCGADRAARRRVRSPRRPVPFDWIGQILSSPTLWVQAVFVFFLFFANFAILFGPLLLMNMSQMQSFEPGDAEWGVKLEDAVANAAAACRLHRAQGASIECAGVGSVGFQAQNAAKMSAPPAITGCPHMSILDCDRRF